MTDTGGDAAGGDVGDTSAHLERGLLRPASVIFVSACLEGASPSAAAGERDDGTTATNSRGSETSELVLSGGGCEGGGRIGRGGNGGGGKTNDGG